MLNWPIRWPLLHLQGQEWRYSNPMKTPLVVLTGLLVAPSHGSSDRAPIDQFGWSGPLARTDPRSGPDSSQVRVRRIPRQELK